MNELEIKIRGEYNSSNYYDFKPPNSNKGFHVMGTEQMRNVLFRMIRDSHLKVMIEVKSTNLELILLIKPK